MKEYVLILLLSGTQYGTGPTIVSGFANEALCDSAGVKLSSEMKKLNRNASISFKCIEIVKSRSNARNTDNITPSEPKSW